MKKLVDIVAKLRAPDGCPWDREQDHQSIRAGLISECYELIEALDALDDRHMKEELGDLLLHVVFHAQLAKERGAFNFNDVVDTICEKLVRRHPHVFGKEKIGNASEVLKRWHEIKKEEKPERTSAIDGVPKQLPALMYAQEIQKKAARVGFDWKETAPVFEKIHEEIDELKKALSKKKTTKRKREIEDELGDLFFALINLSRHLKVDAEQACRLSTKKFIRRFQLVEKEMEKDQIPMKTAPLRLLDEYWEKAKKKLHKLEKIFS